MPSQSHPAPIPVTDHHPALAAPQTHRKRHIARLHQYWHQTPLCPACNDRCETHTLDHCDDRSHYAPGYRDCDECPRCQYCGDRFAERDESDWLFFLPESDLPGEIGWCSERCLSADCDSMRDPSAYAQHLLEDWAECHWGDSGLELSFLDWVGVRTDRELRTFSALRPEVARQHREAHASAALKRHPHHDHDRRAALNRGFGALGAVVEALLKCDLPPERRDYAQKALARIRAEVEA